MPTDSQQDNPSDQPAEEHGRQGKTKTSKRPKFPTREQFGLLVKRANDGDDEARTTLRRVLDAHPQLWERAGDLAVHAQLSLINLVSKGEFFLGEALKRRLDELRKELERPIASPLERLAVERVVASWANLYYCETVALNAGGDLAERKYWLKKQDQAHRQYLSATKSLMLVQTMLERSSPVPPLAATNRRQVADSSSSPGGNGTGGNGHGGGSPVPGFARENDAASQTGFGNGPSENRIAAMVGARS